MSGSQAILLFGTFWCYHNSANRSHMVLHNVHRGQHLTAQTIQPLHPISILQINPSLRFKPVTSIRPLTPFTCVSFLAPSPHASHEHGAAAVVPASGPRQGRAICPTWSLMLATAAAWEEVKSSFCGSIRQVSAGGSLLDIGSS